MKAVFKVLDTVKDWEPPFKTVQEEKEYTVSEGESFSDDKDKGFTVFKVVKVLPDKALVEFSDKYTIKGHEHPADRQIWLTHDAIEKLSALWSKRGLTKVIQFQGIALAEQPQEALLQAEQVQA